MTDQYLCMTVPSKLTEEFVKIMNDLNYFDIEIEEGAVPLCSYVHIPFEDYDFVQLVIKEAFDRVKVYYQENYPT